MDSITPHEFVQVGVDSALIAAFESAAEPGLADRLGSRGVAVGGRHGCLPSFVGAPSMLERFLSCQY